MKLIVQGLAQPGGSKRAFARKRGDGSTFVSVVDANPKAAAWKQEVAHVARQERGDRGPIEGPVVFSCTFYLPRPAGHFGSGRNAGKVRDSAPTHPTGQPDVLKLARAVEDALTAGGAWRDDAQVVEEHLRKVYSETGAWVEIEIRPVAVEAAPQRIAGASLHVTTAPLFGGLQEGS